MGTIPESQTDSGASGSNRGLLAEEPVLFFQRSCHPAAWSSLSHAPATPGQVEMIYNHDFLSVCRGFSITAFPFTPSWKWCRPGKGGTTTY